MKQSEMVEELHFLGIDTDDVRLLLLLPLLHVAWADAQVLHREEALVRAAAKRLSLDEGEAGRRVNGWLAKRPTEVYLRRGRSALRELAVHGTGLGENIGLDDLKFVLEAARAVALAGSGMLGFLRYEPRSRAALEEIVSDLNLDAIDFELDPGWDFTEEVTMDGEPEVREAFYEAATEQTEEELPGFQTGESGFSMGLESFLRVPDPIPTPELIEHVKQSDLRGELSADHLHLVASLLLRGDDLPGYCADQIVPLYEEAVTTLPLDATTQAAMRDPRAVNAIHRAGWDMAHSIRYGGALSGSTVLRDLIVLRTTVYRQPVAALPRMLAGVGGYLRVVSQLSTIEAISEHYGLDAPESCTHFIHLFFCLEPDGAIKWLPVVVPLGDAPGKIILSPELLSEEEKARPPA